MTKDRIYVAKHAAPIRSWWVTDGTRDSFKEAYEREQERMRKNTRTVSGENRTIATYRGRI